MKKIKKIFITFTGNYNGTTYVDHIVGVATTMPDAVILKQEIIDEDRDILNIDNSMNYHIREREFFVPDSE
jgi:hypothetical protein